MKSSVFAAIIVVCIALTATVVSAADSGDTGTRYFVSTTRSFWRNAMGARHLFTEGFTADLNDLQLRIAQLAGLKPVPVKRFTILADAASESVSPTPQMTPSQRVSWSVRAVLGDPLLQATHGGTGVKIALLDTGVERSHPDLAGRVSGCYDVTDPAAPFVDDRCDDLNGHGTHMAGILVAQGGESGTGSYGLAPQASLSAYRVCGPNGNCLSDDIAVAIVHAVDAGANIIVLGLGGESESSFIGDAIGYAESHDVLVVVGAGNNGPYDDSMDWPARDARVVSVGAVDNKLDVADFSSRGLNASDNPYERNTGDVELAAPGVNVESTFREGGYAILSGTSMAAPHIAGLAALVWQFGAEHPAAATRDVLHKMARHIGSPGDNSATGWGFPVFVR